MRIFQKKAATATNNDAIHHKRALFRNILRKRNRNGASSSGDSSTATTTTTSSSVSGKLTAASLQRIENLRCAIANEKRDDLGEKEEEISIIESKVEDEEELEERVGNREHWEQEDEENTYSCVSEEGTYVGEEVVIEKSVEERIVANREPSEAAQQAVIDTRSVWETNNYRAKQKRANLQTNKNASRRARSPPPINVYAPTHCGGMLDTLVPMPQGSSNNGDESTQAWISAFDQGMYQFVSSFFLGPIDENNILAEPVNNDIFQSSSLNYIEMHNNDPVLFDSMPNTSTQKVQNEAKEQKSKQARNKERERHHLMNRNTSDHYYMGLVPPNDYNNGAFQRPNNEMRGRRERCRCCEEMERIEQAWDENQSYEDENEYYNNSRPPALAYKERGTGAKQIMENNYSDFLPKEEVVGTNNNAKNKTSHPSGKRVVYAPTLCGGILDSLVPMPTEYDDNNSDDMQSWISSIDRVMCHSVVTSLLPDEPTHSNSQSVYDEESLPDKLRNNERSQRARNNSMREPVDEGMEQVFGHGVDDEEQQQQEEEGEGKHFQYYILKKWKEHKLKKNQKPKKDGDNGAN